MSKKKVTMTLKDFHGGYIPSDLPLPSAPGLPLRPGDRGGIDRQTSYGNSMGRSDNRLRPASAGSSRNLDDDSPFFNHNLRIGRNFDEDERKPLCGVLGPRRAAGDESIPTQRSFVMEPKADTITPFLGHSLHVGRNFDEDERKPLNGVSGPRRTVSDESIHVQPSRAMESQNHNKMVARVGTGGPGQIASGAHASNFHRSFDDDEINHLGVSGPHRTVGDEAIGTQPSRLVESVTGNISVARVGSQNSQPQSSNSTTKASYAGRVSEMRAGPNVQNFGGGRGFSSNFPNVGGGDEPYTNAWGLGKEVRSVQESLSVSRSTPDPAMKLAQASALEKVSTGRWTSRQHVPSLKNHGVVGEVQIEVRPDYEASNNLENEKVGRMMQADINVTVDMWSKERSPVTVSEHQPVERFVAQPSLLVEPKSDDKSDVSATIVSQDPSVPGHQADSSYFGGPNSFWSKEPVSIGWSSQDIMVNFPHAGSSEKVSYDHWNSTGQTTTKSYDHWISDINHRSGLPNAVGIGNAGKALVGPCSNPWSEYKAMSSMKDHVSVPWSSSVDFKGKLTNDGVIGRLEPEGDFGYKEEKEIGGANDAGGEKEMPTHERVSTFEKHAPRISSSVEAVPSESLVRPKLKLLPRSKPLENSEPQVGLKQGFVQPKDNNIHDENSFFESGNSLISEFAGNEVADPAPQQPKPNLKPQSHPLRETLFGGARPREEVLKEREADGYVDNNSKSQLPSRANETARKDDSSKFSTSTRYSEKAENALSSQRPTSSKYTNNRHAHQQDSSRIDVQRRNIRQNETRKNPKEVDQKHKQKLQERPRSPETWRKPVDQSKPPSSSSSAEDRGPSLRFGKAASAVELAQSFSRSVSDPLLSGSRSIPGRGQIPFSRLVGPKPMLQTNGY